MNTVHKKQEQSGAGILVVMVVILSVLTVVFAGLAVMSYTQYQTKATDVDGQIKVAQAQAQKEQADADDKKFTERYNQPWQQFVGPEDYGRLTFNYPKTWSVYEETDVSRGGDYKAYLNPGKVPPISETQQIAVRVLIQNKQVDQVKSQYESKVKKGDLKVSSTSSGGLPGDRYEGQFSNAIRGVAVVYKYRDKTITLRTDADTFKPVFNDIIKSLTFEQ